jgi:hypothetical protein
LENLALSSDLLLSANGVPSKMTACLTSSFEVLAVDAHLFLRHLYVGLRKMLSVEGQTVAIVFVDSTVHQMKQTIKFTD